MHNLIKLLVKLKKKKKANNSLKIYNYINNFLIRLYNGKTNR